MSKITAAITAVGAYVPEFVLTNAMLENMVETNDEWITTRTGIKERRILKAEGKGTSFLAIKAAQNLIQKASLDPATIDLVIVATATPDMKAASTASYTSTQIGATNAFSYDMDSACSSFLFGMSTAASYIESGRYKKILLIGADKMSSIVNYKDRATCIIFGDGAGAVLLEATEDESIGIKDSILKSDGSGRHYLHMKAGGSLKPASVETVLNKEHFAYQEGQAVFKFAVKGMADVSAELLERNQLTGDDIAWLVPHQANLRIIDATANRMGLDKEKVMINIQKYGNTTAATLPLCLWDWESQLKKGDNIVLAAFGGGFTWGATLLTWGYDSK